MAAPRTNSFSSPENMTREPASSGKRISAEVGRSAQDCRWRQAVVTTSAVHARALKPDTTYI
jgi:hypothetical protein